MPNQQSVDYPSFKLVIVGDGGTGNVSPLDFVVLVRKLVFIFIFLEILDILILMNCDDLIFSFPLLVHIRLVGVGSYLFL